MSSVGWMRSIVMLVIVENTTQREKVTIAYLVAECACNDA